MYQRMEQEHRKGAEKRLEAMRICGIGKVAPEIVGVDLNGREVKLSEYRGKVVLLSFWATWCGPCMRLVPHEREIAARLKDKPFAIVGVNGDTDETAIKNALTKHEITWPSFHDRQANKAAISDEWKNIGWPTLYLIDREGVIRGKWLGEPPPERLNQAIDKILDAAP
jgi:thiol-disulfide isomerase/thioredoxin